MKSRSLRYGERSFGRSREGAWIEILLNLPVLLPILVAPVRERGLKYLILKNHLKKKKGRSREGAWIEIGLRIAKKSTKIVAPVRERGLKFLGFQPFTINHSRSRKGAWIEINSPKYISTKSSWSLP